MKNLDWKRIGAAVAVIAAASTALGLVWPWDAASKEELSAHDGSSSAHVDMMRRQDERCENRHEKNLQRILDAIEALQ